MLKLTVLLLILLVLVVGCTKLSEQNKQVVSNENTELEEGFNLEDDSTDNFDSLDEDMNLTDL